MSSAIRATSTVQVATDSGLRRRLLGMGILMLGVYGGGTLGYYALGAGRWSLSDCAYMTVISLTTVGYGETLEGLNQVPWARAFTSFLLVCGAGVAVYFVSVLTTFLVGGEFLQLRRRRRMQKRIAALKGHIIVCGVGGTGSNVVDELVAAHWPLIVLDVDQAKLDRCQERHSEELASMCADATDDSVLIAAGIQRAHGVVACLPDDKGNLYVVVTARSLNPKLRVVAKAVDPQAARKLESAGADSVVSVNRIGGLRLVSEMIRPHVVHFLDKMLRDKDRTLRFEEVVIPKASPLAGVRLAESDIRRHSQLLVVAARDTASGEYFYNPGPDYVLEEGMALIVMGETRLVSQLRKSPLFQTR